MVVSQLCPYHPLTLCHRANFYGHFSLIFDILWPISPRIPLYFPLGLFIQLVLHTLFLYFSCFSRTHQGDKTKPDDIIWDPQDPLATRRPASS